MKLIRKMSLVFAALALASLAACKGGGGGSTINIVSITTNPATVTAGSVVALSASISAPGQSVSSLTKHWSVTAGELLTTPPDFSLLMRQTAKAASASFIDTTNSVVYWVTPASGTTTITLQVDTATKSRTINVGASPISLSVTSAGTSRTCTVMANNVTDLYQAAFRINYTSAWTPSNIEAGTFLGAAGDVLWIGQDDTDDTWLNKCKTLGFVPFAITRKGSAAGVDGSGILATVVFDASSGTSSARELSEVPFDLSLVILRDSRDELLNLSGY